jgi:hypothetical protein
MRSVAARFASGDAADTSPVKCTKLYLPVVKKV